MTTSREILIHTSAPVRRVFGAVSKFALLVVFCLQALIPQGYMPAATSTGAILQICPDGLYFSPAEGPPHVHHHAAGHAHHHAEVADDVSRHEHHAATENCAFATLLAEAQELGEALASLELARQTLQVELKRTQVLARTPQLGFTSRAPPHLS